MMATAMATTTKAHDHPPYKEMIVSAIGSLKDRKGSSKTAIAKYIASKYNDLPPTHDALLATHLRRLKQKGIVQMIKHSYKLVGLNDTNSGPKKPGLPAKKLKLDNAVVGPPEKRNPGRPKKVVQEEKRRAGRPRKDLASVIALILPRNLKTKLKPGRPKKVVGEGKRGAGRPRKESAPVFEPILPRNLKMKLKPGRPKKSNSGDVVVSGEKRKPGRPKKVLGVVENGNVSKLGEKRKPGPPKKAAKGEGGPLGGTKRRGRPPKEGMPAVAAKTGSEVKRPVGRPKKKNVEA